MCTTRSPSSTSPHRSHQQWANIRTRVFPRWQLLRSSEPVVHQHSIQRPTRIIPNGPISTSLPSTIHYRSPMNIPRLAVIYLWLALSSCQCYWTPVQPEDQESFPPHVDIEDVVGRNNIRAREALRNRPGFPSQDVQKATGCHQGSSMEYRSILEAFQQNEGPLELTRRQKMFVWDDELVLNEDDVDEDNEPPTPTSPLAPSIHSIPFHHGEHTAQMLMHFHRLECMRL
ncbi:hypothetical protein CYLTODRAFT_265741 [Cylindrobasidium torrendii FP15055 ss-10]|uniref:Uncharacterized protein n=1 Tax=Cylindrobasidium torrendii FP15055 ss-10 TaxID=1314674 RepID=A0A0D7AR84_9AGAR|nr:hypothetical protein CYLTODRAFT_265741 [Cylindrobasidium torrendii FP15055 ss-10]